MSVLQHRQFIQPIHGHQSAVMSGAEFVKKTLTVPRLTSMPAFLAAFCAACVGAAKRFCPHTPGLVVHATHHRIARHTSTVGHVPASPLVAGPRDAKAAKQARGARDITAEAEEELVRASVSVMSVEVCRDGCCTRVP
eukprot:scaffold244055_cov22-Tisochrysis_lutea.AAC.1